MTVRDAICEFCDSKLYPDMEQEVRFAYGDLVFDGFAGADIPENGPATVKLRMATGPSTHKYMFSLKFEANPVIEAENLEEAGKKAVELMRNVKVVRDCCSGIYVDRPDYVAQEPYFLEEVEE